MGRYKRKKGDQKVLKDAQRIALYFAKQKEKNDSNNNTTNPKSNSR